MPNCATYLKFMRSTGTGSCVFSTGYRTGKINNLHMLLKWSFRFL